MRSSGSAFCRNIRELREDHAEANKNLFKGSLQFWQFIVSSMLYIISTPFDYMHQLSFHIYLTIQLPTRCLERESGFKYASDSVYLWKIENSS